MRWLKRILIVFLGLMLALVSALPFMIVEKPLSDTVTVFQPRINGLGANVVVHRSSGKTTLVDSQLGIMAKILAWKIDSLNATDVIYITHWHPDHSGGYLTLKGQAQVYAHLNTVSILARDHEGIDLTAPGSRHQFAAIPAARLPEQFSSTDQPGKLIEVQHYAAAHTAGDLVVFFDGATVVALADLVWPGSFPFVDIHTGGSIKGILAALDSIIARSHPATRFVPGHGPDIDMDELKQYRAMIAGSLGSVSCVSGQSSLDQWGGYASKLVSLQRWHELLRVEAGCD